MVLSFLLIFSNDNSFHAQVKLEYRQERQKNLLLEWNTIYANLLWYITVHYWALTKSKIELPMIYFCLKNDIDWKFVGRASVPLSFAALFELKAEVIL